ncbi:DUF2911 domain-containing protein [Flexithrix dorotheae]|uniref:DUF2911 domain-containing protein n=1 Tax=Flexithrix dorotheae TaxID=70993 RepID=UPI00036A8742|nr:DUF2911 domain-containing protein [Flexithrix dorotheae]
MKNYGPIKQLLVFLCSIFFANELLAQGALTFPPSGDNEKASVSQWIGLVKVNVTYNSPDVTGPQGEDRTGKIYGTNVVPYGFAEDAFAGKAIPWRAGANENTVFYVSHDVKIEGQDLPAGKYGLHMAPGEDEWTIIFSKNYTSWGSYSYDEKEDALRVTIKPEKSEFNEYLTFEFTERKPDHATVALKWENLMVPIKVEVPNINDLYIAKMRDDLRNSAGFTWQNFRNAAEFCANNEINMEEALTWADLAINRPYIGQENFQTLSTKAKVLGKLGKTTDADKLMAKAVEHPTATILDLHNYGRGLLGEGKNEKALEIFLLNKKKHPEDQFTPNVGLARCYTAMGEKKKAIKHWEVALQNIPENQKPNLAYYEGELRKLKEGDSEAGK